MAHETQNFHAVVNLLKGADHMTQDEQDVTSENYDQYKNQHCGCQKTKRQVKMSPCDATINVMLVSAVGLVLFYGTISHCNSLNPHSK